MWKQQEKLISLRDRLDKHLGMQGFLSETTWEEDDRAILEYHSPTGVVLAHLELYLTPNMEWHIAGQTHYAITIYD